VRKLQIGKVVEQLTGKPQSIVEDGVKRDMTVRDVIVELIPIIAGQKSPDALALWDTGIKIRNCKDDVIELEDHDYNVLKAGLDTAQSFVWAQAALAKAFSEAERPLSI